MKKLIASGALGAAMLVSTVSGTFAQGHTELGVPGTPGCKGKFCSRRNARMRRPGPWVTPIAASVGENKP